MNIEAQPNNVIVPTDPAPQTVSGIMSTTGIGFSDTTTTFGDELDFSAVLGRWHLLRKVLVNTTDTDIYHEEPIVKSYFARRHFWHAILSMYKYITCDVVLRFQIIKPLATAGKMMFQYTSKPRAAFDAKMRSFKIEWDMSKDSYIDIPVTGHQLGKYRLCNSIHYTGGELPPGQDYAYMGYAAREEFIKYGTFNLSIISPFQPGSIYPDSYTLLSFVSFRNVVLSIPRNYLTSDVEHLVALNPTVT